MVLGPGQWRVASWGWAPAPGTPLETPWLNGVYGLEQGDSQPEMHTVRSALRVPDGGI